MLGCYLSLYPHKTDFNWGAGVLGKGARERLGYLKMIDTYFSLTSGLVCFAHDDLIIVKSSQEWYQNKCIHKSLQDTDI